MRWRWRKRGRELQQEIAAVLKEADEFKRAIKEQQPILDEALRRRDHAVERSRQAARTLEEVLVRAFREGIGND